MSNKAIALLKVLLHGDIHLDEITKYVDLDINSIERNINVTNDINISSYLMQESIFQEGRIDEYGKHVEYVFQ